MPEWKNYGDCQEDDDQNAVALVVDMSGSRGIVHFFGPNDDCIDAIGDRDYHDLVIVALDPGCKLICYGSLRKLRSITVLIDPVLSN